MSNSHLELVREVTALKGYSYRVWEYHASLSELTVRAYRLDKPKHNIHIVFQGVVYLQMPIHWKAGDLRLGSEAELREVTKKIGLGEFDPDKFFKADTSNGEVYVLGGVAAILRDVEPLY
ncbi:MAG: hypothetical protein NUW24_16720 [Anaerolineae bacterium]|jgi:hypothetical protein|nr:hypothetical protein [Anaerolineae bacterium]MDH7474985.1 hypothetical protein [Anaerolineae bacterium]